MRVAISGKNREDLVKSFEKKFNVKSVKPFEFDCNYPVIDYAAESDSHWSDENVVFDGCVLDAPNSTGAEAYDNIIEQICLNSINNLDLIYVMYSQADDKEKEMYDSYINLFPHKFKKDTEVEF